jgi:hypothetical protein
MKLERREFLKDLVQSGRRAVLASRALYSQIPESKIEILINEPIGAINKDLYSHFVEHLGGCCLRRYMGWREVEDPELQRHPKRPRRQPEKAQAGVIRYPGAALQINMTGATA